MEDIIEKACKVDLAGETFLEYLLLLPDQELWIMSHYNVWEIIDVST